MAITNAQQYQQLVNKPANGKRPGYRGDYSYGNPSGAGYDPGEGQASEGSGISEGSGGFAPTSQAAIGTGGYTAPTFTGGSTSYQGVTVSQEAKDKAAKDKKEAEEKEKLAKEKRKENTTLFGTVKDYFSKIKNINNLKQRQRFIDSLSTLERKELGMQGFDFGDLNSNLLGTEEISGLDALNAFGYKDGFYGGGDGGNGGGGGGGNQQQTDPCLGPNPPAYCNVGGGDDDDDTTTPDRNLGGLAPRFAGSIFDFTGLADGGRAGAMDGGRMMMMANQEEDDPTGGIMDLESGRQMYFLGKLVKKATRAVKKIAKSPIGKAALIYFGGGALGNLAGGSGLGGMFKGAMTPGQFFTKNKLAGIFSKGGAKNILFGGQKLMGNAAKNNFVDFSGILGSGGKSSLGKTLGLSLGLPFALDALGIGKEEDDDSAYEKYMKDMRLDIPALRGRRNLAANFDGSTYNYEAYADGGRTGYQEGSKEPVAKETMPLIDMDGKEMDLREDGGFVPLGRMERADDVPARLSKNEFVFTADAVRNAGEGDIDKGAEVMYNMMKNLESGGEVSEESQGLDGAREMFKTSQRLEEVL